MAGVLVLLVSDDWKSGHSPESTSDATINTTRCSP